MGVGSQCFICEHSIGQLHWIGDAWIGDKAKFGQMRTKRIYDHRALAYNQRPGPVRRQNA